MNFFLDECGQTGDLAKRGALASFSQQPVFSLATVGVEDEASFTLGVEKLKTKHGIQSAELKSSARRDRSDFIYDVVRMLCMERYPFFVEIVDKRFFLAAHIVSLQLLPAIPGLLTDARTHYFQNVLADYLAERTPDAVFLKFIEACLSPSVEALESQLELLIESARADEAGAEVAFVACDLAETARRDFRESLGEGEEKAFLRYLPFPDKNKHDKQVWILPNLSSFTNIYARINRHRQGRLSDVHLIHDEQLQFDAILEQAKTTAESLQDAAAMFMTPHSDFHFRQSATLSFASSRDSSGLQVADLLAGFCMRYVKAFFANRDAVSATAHRTYDLLRLSTDPISGSGLNLVISNEQARSLSLFALGTLCE
jgi:Protein of unknown function (DUF3800)